MSKSYIVYLYFIYEKLKEDEIVKAVMISKYFNITRASVFKIINQFLEENYIMYKEECAVSKSIIMTKKGKDFCKYYEVYVKKIENSLSGCFTLNSFDLRIIAARFVASLSEAELNSIV